MTQNVKAAAIWGQGGTEYERISRSIADSIDHCVLRLDPRRGERILDLATGTGWTSRALARSGATVIGVDFADGVLQSARELADAEGLAIDYRLGNAEALPFTDGEFDAVASTSGVIFASNPEAAASELARITHPGSRIALTAWPRGGKMFELDQMMHRYVPRNGGIFGAHFRWGDPRWVRGLLGRAFDLRFEPGVSYYREPSAEAAWQTFSLGHGPTKALLAWLDQKGRAALRQDFVDFHNKFRTELGVSVPREYLLIYGIRR